MSRQTRVNQRTESTRKSVTDNNESSLVVERVYMSDVVRQSLTIDVDRIGNAPDSLTIKKNGASSRIYEPERVK